jgi:hypothetical protein
LLQQERSQSELLQHDKSHKSHLVEVCARDGRRILATVGCGMLDGVEDGVSDDDGGWDDGGDDGCDDGGEIKSGAIPPSFASFASLEQVKHQ